MRDVSSNRSLRLGTCRDEWDSPAAFRRLMVIHRMGVVVVRRLKFVNGPLAQLLVIPVYRWMTIYVVRESIVDASHVLRNQLKRRSHRW